MSGVTERLVVVGGDAAGMSAASQAKRLAGDKLEVIAFERGQGKRRSQRSRPHWIRLPSGLCSGAGLVGGALACRGGGLGSSL